MVAWTFTERFPNNRTSFRGFLRKKIQGLERTSRPKQHPKACVSPFLKLKSRCFRPFSCSNTGEPGFEPTTVQDNRQRLMFHALHPRRVGQSHTRRALLTPLQAPGRRQNSICFISFHPFSHGFPMVFLSKTLENTADHPLRRPLSLQRWPQMVI